MSCVVCGRCACGAADAFGVNVDNIGTKLAVSSFKREVAAEGRIAELERAAAVAETERLRVKAMDYLAAEQKRSKRYKAEHAAALGLATARIRELEGERAELLGLLNDRQRLWCPVVEYPKGLRVDKCSWAPPCWEHRRRAIVARIEKATKGTT